MTPKVIFFDINETLLDMQAIKTGLASVLNGDETLVDLWFANLLHHSLVDVASGQFHDFIDIGAAVLTMVAHSKDISVDEATAKDIIKQHITRLPAHDDVVPTLKALQSAGVTLVALSNSSKAGLDAQLEFANIKPYFSHVLSVESVRTYKPHAAVYHWAWTGMQTTFVERPGKMMYPLGLAPDHSIGSLTELIAVISSQ